MSPGLKDSSLVVAWSQDAGRLGPGVTDFLRQRLEGKEVGGVEPRGFFPLTAVSIEDDVIQFPESRFYSCEDKGPLLFRSDPPHTEHFRFLNSVLDFAVNQGHGKTAFALGGMVSYMAHTVPRRVSAVVTQKELKRSLAELGVDTGLNFQTPPGVRPTLNSFLLWTARRRDIPGATLWAPVPFYITPSEDFRAWKEVLRVLDGLFHLGLDLSELDQEIATQDEKLKELISLDPDIGKSIAMLERGIVLEEREREKLAQRVTEFLAKKP